MKGLIFSVKRYAIHDGPGIRVTFFMKGCPLSCRWCHNPEGISPLPEKVKQVNKVGEKEFLKTEVVGKFYSVEDLLIILEKERIFIDQSKGGVTFSGGEPMMQYDFLFKALKACRGKGFHTCVDTSGFSSADRFKEIIPFTDLFLFDLKHLDSVKHKEFTGVSNEIIISNYKMIVESDKGIMIRIPVIPGFNDDTDHLNRLRQFLLETKSEHLIMINLLPYHKIGASKYKRFNMPNKMENVEQPTFRRLEELKALFSDLRVRVKIGG